jgi:amino acid adenylation domain-containing protein
MHTPADTTPDLLAGQQRLWLLGQLEGGNAAYNVPIAFRLKGVLNRELLAQALHDLARRHEALRTRLIPRDGRIALEVDHEGAGFPFTVEDLRHAPDPEGRLADLQREECQRPFSMSERPLARARLLILGEQHHVLLLTVHHIMFDGWSQTLMLNEIGVLYDALMRDVEADLPELTDQFAAYRSWQKRWLTGTEAEAQANYWVQRLAGAPALLELPSDRPRPAQQDYSGGRVRVTIDRELTTALRRLAAEHGVSLFSIVLTAWSIVLSRLTGQSDLVIGVPSANRRRGDIGSLMGFFVNSLALRVDLSGPSTGSELLKRVRAELRDALDNVDLPFDHVVEAVNPPRSTAHTPLFQVMCAWVPTTGASLELSGVAVEPVPSAFTSAKFDLALGLADEGEVVAGDLDYATALFDQETIERHLSQLIQVLTQLVEDPDRDVAEIDLLSDRERRNVLEAWGVGRQLAEPSSPGLLERFHEQVRERPAQTAVLWDGQSLSYAGLDRRANRLAQALIARGIGPGQVVGLHAGRSVGLVVGVLGILKAGAAYLPLDPEQPAERLGSMVETACPTLVLSDFGVPATGWQSLTAVEASAALQDRPAVAVGAQDLAYVIYTSGSTGRPKGVAVTHGSVLALLDQWVDRFGARPGEVASAWSSIGFDASVHELLMPLTTGAVLALVPEDLRGDPQALMDWMATHNVTQAFLPPAYVRWIAEDPLTRLKDSALRRLLTGVESLPEAALHRMQEVLPGLRICFGYGPTEATLYSTAYTAPKPLDRPCPIGRPLPGTRLYLLDERLQPVPAGAVGEIYLGGVSLARGYLGQPALTAERFVANPFVPGERLYRTGDTARWLNDGNASFVGRRDDQIKLRGFRIEPAEVEAALLAVPGVAEAAVLADRDASGELRLVAGIGRGETASRSWHQWRAELAGRLPDYMIPSVFVEVPRLPQTLNGKLDRAAVLIRARSADQVSVNALSPRDVVEMELYRIWRDLLVRPTIGVTDNFFDLGGTSISAIKVAHEIQQRLGRSVPIRDVITHPTIEALAARIRTVGAREGSGSGSVIELRAGGGTDRLVCIHPAGGTAFCYLPLAAALPEHIGVIGVQSPGIQQGEVPLATVGAMARQYLEWIIPRPEETLVLCGLSFGGLVAHEMGRLLSERGHTQVSVMLLDTQVAQNSPNHAAAQPVDRQEFREKLVRFNGMYPGIEDAQIERYFRIYNHNRATAHGHDSSPSAARLSFVQAAADTEQDDADRTATVQFWRERAHGDFSVTSLPCGHWDLLEKRHVPRIAELITGELNHWTGGTPPRTAVRGPQSNALEA